MNAVLKILFLTTLWLTSTISNGQKTYRRNMKLMGCEFNITVVAGNARTGERYIDTAVKEIERIENLISSWEPNSQTARINRNAGVKPVKVNEELYNLIKRSIEISKITNGAFDITYASMDKIWKFDGTMQKMPDEVRIKASVSKVGYKNIVLDSADQSVFLKKKDMKIGFGAIGKGFAADKAKALLRKKGVKGGIINASGDIIVWGSRPDGSRWNVGIKNPINNDKIFAYLPVKNGVVVTSGDYEKYVILNGKRYSHIIDPKTGYPTHGLVSATVFAPSAELADALATSLMVMGKEVSLSFINQLPDIYCVLVNDSGEVFKSENIKLDITKS